MWIRFSKPLLALLVALLTVTTLYSAATCILQKAETSIRVIESYDEDTGQLSVSARLTYTNPDTGRIEGLGQQELEFIVNYTTAEGEKSDKFKMQTDTTGWATINFVIPGATKYTVTVVYKGNNLFKESIGTAGGSARSSTSFETGLPPDINLVACLPLLILAGFLGAAMYASGRNPFGVVDFTAPRGITTQRRVMKAFQAGWFAPILATTGGILGTVATMLAGAEKVSESPKEKKAEKEKEGAAPPKSEEKKGLVEGVGGPLKPKHTEKKSEAAQPPPKAAPPAEKAVATLTDEDVRLPSFRPKVGGVAEALGFIGLLMTLLSGNVRTLEELTKRKEVIVVERDENGNEVKVRRLVTSAMYGNVVNKIKDLADNEKARLGSIDKDGNAYVLVWDDKDKKWIITDLNSIKKDLENEKNNLQKIKSELEKQKDKNEKSTKDLKEQISKIEEKISSLKKGILENNELLNEKKKNAANLEKEIKNLEKEKADLQAKILQPKKGESDEERKTREKNNAEIQKKIDEIDKKLKATKEKYEIALTQVNAYSITTQKKSEELKKASVELSQTKYKLETLKKNTSALAEHIEENEKNIKKIDKVLSDINDTIANNKKVYDRDIANLSEKYGKELEKAGVKKEEKITVAVIDKVIKNLQDDLKSAKTSEEKSAIKEKINDLERISNNMQKALEESIKTESAAYIFLELAKSNALKYKISVGRGRFICDSNAEEIAKADAYEKAHSVANEEKIITDARGYLNKAEFLMHGKNFKELDEEKKATAFMSVEKAYLEVKGIAEKYNLVDEDSKLQKVPEELRNGNVEKAIKIIDSVLDDAKNKVRNNMKETADFAAKLGVGVEPEVRIKQLSQYEIEQRRETKEVYPNEVVVEHNIPKNKSIDGFIGEIVKNQDIKDAAITQNIYINTTIDEKYTAKEIIALQSLKKIDNIDEKIAEIVEKNPLTAEVLRKAMDLESTATPVKIAEAYKNNKNKEKIDDVLNNASESPPTPLKQSTILENAAYRNYGGFAIKSASFDNAVESLKKEAYVETVGKIIDFKEQEDYYNARKEYEEKKAKYDSLAKEYEQNKSEEALNELKNLEKELADKQNSLKAAESAFDKIIEQTGGNIAEKKEIMKSDKTFEEWKKARTEYEKFENIIEASKLQDSTYTTYLIQQKGDKEFYSKGKRDTYNQALADKDLADGINKTLVSTPAGFDKISDLLR